MAETGTLKEDGTAEAELKGSEGQKNSTVEEIAREWGHQSKEDFEANPENEGKEWIDAESYVRNQRDVSDAYKRRDKKLEREVAEVRQGMRDLIEHNRTISAREKEVRKEERQKLLAELDNRLDTAAEEGNKDEVKKITNQITSLSTEAVKTEAEEEQTKANVTTGAESPTVKEWKKANKWYEDDADPINVALTGYADKLSAEIARGNPDLSWEEIFEELDPKIKTLRASLGGENSKRTVSPAGGGTPTGGNRRKSFSDLPDDAKDKCRRLVKLGTFGTDDKKAVQKYVNEYFGQEE